MLITKQQVFSVCGIELDFAKQKMPFLSQEFRLELFETSGIDATGQDEMLGG